MAEGESDEPADQKDRGNDPQHVEREPESTKDERQKQNDQY